MGDLIHLNFVDGIPLSVEEKHILDVHRHEKRLDDLFASGKRFEDLNEDEIDLLDAEFARREDLQGYVYLLTQQEERAAQKARLRIVSKGREQVSEG